MAFDSALFPVVFVFGLAAGSFLNCAVYRLELEQGFARPPAGRAKASFFSGRSFCPCCGRRLSWRDLVPVLSFVILGKKCRHCEKPISWQYPSVELGTGALFTLVFSSQLPISGFRDLLALAYYLAAACFLVIVFVYDLKHYVIPDKVVYPAIAMAAVYNLQFAVSGEFQIFKFSILGAALASGFFLAVFLMSRGKWMGFGDVKLAFFMGLLLGWPEILAALFMAFFIGAIIGAGLVLSGKKALKSEVPFGPFLAAAALASLFWGEKMVGWYLNLLA